MFGCSDVWLLECLVVRMFGCVRDVLSVQSCELYTNRGCEVLEFCVLECVFMDCWVLFVEYRAFCITTFCCMMCI